MDIFEAYSTCIKKYATFSGRARRSEYWLFSFCNLLIGLLLSGIAYFALAAETEGLAIVLYILSILYSLFVLLPSLAVLVRRLHDGGYSGCFYFVSLIPLVGTLILLVLLCKDSIPGSNMYGPNPKVGCEVASVPPAAEIPPVSSGPAVSSSGSIGTEPIKTFNDGYETVSLKSVLKATCARGPIAGTSAVGEVIYIGRDPQLCQLVFPDGTPGVSKVHCMLHTDGRSIEVCDLGSRYGTFLANRARLTPNEKILLMNGNDAQANKADMNTIYIGSESVAISVELSPPLRR